ncbi:glycosyltransferase family 4 protein [Prochlorothrix hollandica]|uniref:glycosyltransferase family 4 protein n=1 Tax=Prochlorothrix hollandica TaxID=1223 RepID=UPI0003487AE0|nr:glycosyltransferase family 1 protein [Prochlorothrix hollandica]
MNIGIDCSLILPHMAGIGQYTWNLILALSSVDTCNSYLLYPVFEYNRDYQYYVNHLIKNSPEIHNKERFKVAYRRVPKKLTQKLWNHTLPFIRNLPSLENHLKYGCTDIIHGTSFFLPEIQRRSVKIITLYDLSFLTHPQFHTQETVRNCTEGIKKSLEIADAVLVISENTKRDLLSYFQFDPEKVYVTYLGKDPSYSKVLDPECIAQFLKKYSLPASYLLFVGSMEPRKNLKSLLQAYSLLSSSLREKYKLVIAGPQGWLNTDIFELAQNLNLLDNVYFTGYIPQDDMALLYSAASLFIYPSFYEGFGLPVLEAMSCGVPTITSNVASIPEITGNDGALLIDPYEPESISEAISDVLNSPSLAFELSTQAESRSQLFSWSNCAQQTLAVYQRFA